MRRRRQMRGKGVIVVGLRVGELLAEVPGTDGDLTALHEVPGQFAEYRLVLEMLRVHLSERDVPRSRTDVKDTIRQASLRHLIFRSSRYSDGPCALARLIFVERAQNVIKQVVRA